MFSKYLFAVATASSPLFALFASAATCDRSYVIKEGDICDSISAAQGVSTYQLAVVNNGIIDAACSNLTPGNTICLGYKPDDCTSVYVVKKDDTCDAIISAYGIDATTLWTNNPQIDTECYNIYIGEVLCVANSKVVPAPPPNYVPAPIPSTATPAPPAYTGNSDDDLPWCDEL